MNAQQRQAALEAARDGDADQLGRLLNSFRPYIRAVVRACWDARLTGRLGESDLIQDALLQAAQSFARFRGSTVAELVVWLRQIVVRSARDTIESLVGTARRNPEREVFVANLDELPGDPGLDPFRQLVARENGIRVADALARLPDDMQEVLLGRHVAGLPHAAIARKLGRSEGAIRMLYLRGLQQLRDFLEGEDDD